jgi:hypothetical protein
MRLNRPEGISRARPARCFPWSEPVVRGGVEPPTFRFSGGLPSPGQSTIGGLTRPYGMQATLGVQDQPHVSTAVVSTALARPAEIVLSIAQVFLRLALVGDHRASERR